jgi:hypothetical protein
LMGAPVVYRVLRGVTGFGKASPRVLVWFHTRLDGPAFCHMARRIGALDLCRQSIAN